MVRHYTSDYYMSAKEFYHKDIVYTPVLPPEIWGAIIQQATYVPGGYEPDFMTLGLGIPATTLEKVQLRRWKTSLVTRRNVLRVNKTWYNLTAPFLYEYVLLGRGNAVQPLSLAMERSADATESTTSLGWWTQRLDVNLRDCWKVNPQIIMNALARILGCLRNLRILTFSITGHRYRPTLPSNVLQSLTCCHTLRVVHWYTDQFPSITSMSSFLCRYPLLRSINANEVMQHIMLQVQLESLEVIHVHGTDFIDGEAPTLTRHLWAIDLPSVRSATYDVEFSCNDEALVYQFFSRLGPQLQTILIYQARPTDSNMELEFNLQTTFDQLCDHCHALEQINLLLHGWFMFGLQMHVLPAKVSRIVVRILKDQLSRSAAYELFNTTLHDLKKRNPQLRTIQFHTNSNIQKLRRHPRALSQGLQLLTSLGLSILDEEGDVLAS